jgi:hypothetical protein
VTEYPYGSGGYAVLVTAKEELEKSAKVGPSIEGPTPETSIEVASRNGG